MGDFQVIETQEQLDAVLSEKVKVEREQFQKKYKEYLSPEDFQKKVTEYETKIKELDTALKGANEQIVAHGKEIAERDTKIRAYEAHSLKSKIAHETGLTYEAIDFLNGEDEKTIRKNAEALKALVGNHITAPLASTETSVSNAQNVALKNILKGLRGE